MSFGVYQMGQFLELLGSEREVVVREREGRGRERREGVYEPTRRERSHDVSLPVLFPLLICEMISKAGERMFHRKGSSDTVA